MNRKKPILLVLALPVYIPFILMSMGTTAVKLVIPLLAVELTGSYGIASLTFAMMGVGTLMSDIPAGFIVTRLGHRHSIALGITVLALTTFFAGLKTSVLLLGVAGFFIGAGWAIITLVMMTFIAETVTVETGRAMSAVGGSMRIGALFGPIIGGFLIKYFGFQITMIVASLIIASAAAFVPFLREIKKNDSKTRSTNPLKHTGTILRTHRSTFLTAGLAVIGLQLLRSARPLLVPLWGKDIGLDAAQIGLISGIPMALEMTMFYPVGSVMDRFGRKWTAVPCMLLLSIALVFIPLCHSFGTFLFVVLIAAFGNGLGSGIVLTLGADFSPDSDRADFLGIWRFVGDMGHTTSPFVIGLITQLFTLTAAAVTSGGIGLVATLIMIFLVKETRRAP